MPSIMYCPRCSVLLKNQGAATCHRCGADISYEAERKTRTEEELRRKSELVDGPFHPVIGLKCPICGEDVEIMPPRVEEFVVKGRSMGMGRTGELRADTKGFVGFQPWRCRKRHMLFSSFEVEWKEMCPKCMMTNHPFGKLVRSCPKCAKMVPIGHYKRADPLDLMAGKGYSYHPELEKRIEGGRTDGR